jgi:hypothetical protein
MSSKGVAIPVCDTHDRFENYLKKCDEADDEARRRFEAIQRPQGNLREILLARARAKGLLGDQARLRIPVAADR